MWYGHVQFYKHMGMRQELTHSATRAENGRAVAVRYE